MASSADLTAALARHWFDRITDAFVIQPVDSTGRIIQAIYAINMLWHTAATYFFLFRTKGILRKYLRLPVPASKDERPTPPSLAVDMMRFLGAINFGYAVLAAIALAKALGAQLSVTDALILSLANFSQFAYDVVVTVGGRARPALIQITLMDLFCGVADAALCGWILVNGTEWTAQQLVAGVSA